MSLSLEAEGLRQPQGQRRDEDEEQQNDGDRHVEPAGFSQYTEATLARATPAAMKIRPPTGGVIWRA